MTEHLLASWPAPRLTSFRRALLGWYDRNRRALPWRRNRDSYRVWVAEVMLQQTRIEAVVPAYQRFVRALPSLASLARAPEGRILALWSGLGYYSRARALHRAARELVRRGERNFPRDLETARRLPGVGPYTARAVLSIAHGAPLAAVDGNVVRVISRLGCLARPSTRGEPHAALAHSMLDKRRPGDWNQAMMELGQTICTPRAPRCGECPAARWCGARSRQAVALYPPSRPRPAPEHLELTLILSRDRRRRLLLERGTFPFLTHMWLPPVRQVTRRRPPDAYLGKFHHSIMYRRFEIEVYARRLQDARFLACAAPTGSGVERRLFDAAALSRIGRSSLLSKALAVEASARSAQGAASVRT